ncbi:MAG: hypothetical protein IPG92_13575 [Flavobacteriales bacterium]|nr:hypothetical protein [Flavobacteriales bacterium]
MRSVLSFPAVLLTVACAAQSASPSVIASWGGSANIGVITIEQTTGEVMVSTIESSSVQLTQGFHQAEPVLMRANIRAFLQGPFDEFTGLMRDDLRSLGLVPLGEPYSALGFPQFGGGGELTTASALAITGSDAIVDWVHVQLRDKNDPSAVVSTRNALVQADGDVVDVDGSSPVRFVAPADSYFISVHHRNHFGVMSLTTLLLTSTAVALDFTDGSTATYGTDAQTNVGAVQVMWCGDVNADGSIRYVGAANDRDLILVAIGGTVPTNTAAGYGTTDVNLDGITRYVGLANDRDPILVNIGGSVPTNVRQDQLP